MPEENLSTCRRNTTKKFPFWGYHHPATEEKHEKTTNSSICASLGTFTSTHSHEIQVHQRRHPFRISLAIRNLKVSRNFYIPTMRSTAHSSWIYAMQMNTGPATITEDFQLILMHLTARDNTSKWLHNRQTVCDSSVPYRVPCGCTWYISSEQGPVCKDK